MGQRVLVPAQMGKGQRDAEEEMGLAGCILGVGNKKIHPWRQLPCLEPLWAAEIHAGVL